MRFRHGPPFDSDNSQSNLSPNSHLPEDHTETLSIDSSKDELNTLAIDNIMLSTGNTPFYKQPWFLPVAIVGLILFGIQLFPVRSPDPNGSHIITKNYGEAKSSDIHEIVAAQVRQQLIESSQVQALTSKSFPPIAKIPDSKRLRIAVTGGAGFVGSHLVDRLMMAGHQVIPRSMTAHKC